jgi:serine/threonine protein kinase
LAFKPLGKSLYDILKMNQYQGFSMKLVQSFFKQVLSSIGFLHKIGYTHTDLKPENILLESQDLLKYEGFTTDAK